MRGFTLIEVMIAVVILGIIASIALPSYENYVLRSQRSQALAALLELQARQDGFFADRRRYAGSLTLLGYPADPSWLGRHGEPDTAEGPQSTYRIELSEVSASGYTLSAIPVGRQTRDQRCGTLSVVASGRKRASGSDGVDCWR